jgi:hypothetical protein
MFASLMRDGRVRRISIVAGLIALTVITFHSQARHLFSVPDRGDPLFSMWRIAWVQHQLVADPRHLFDANIFYPLRATLTYSDAMILPAMAAWPLAWIGVHPVIAYNLVLLATFVLSGLAAYLLVRALDLGTAAAWIAAVAFAFCTFRINHFSHLEMQMTMWMPLALLALSRLLQTGRPRYVALAAGALAAQWYSSMYFGLFLTVYTAVFAATLQIAWKIPLRRTALALAAFLMAGLMVFPLGMQYSRTKAIRGVRQIESVAEFSATPSDYVRPIVGPTVYRTLLPQRINGERALFPGFAVLILALIGAWPPLTTTRAALILAGLIAFDGSLGLNGLLYPLLYRLVFPFQSIRVPARFDMLVTLTLAVLAAYGASRALSRATTRLARFVCVAALTGLLMVDSWPRYDMEPMWDAPPSIYQSLPASAVLFEFPVHPPADRFLENVMYMYFSMWHWRPMVNGYSGFNPQQYADTLNGTRGFPAPATLVYLKSAGVTHVTVHCRYWDEMVCEAAMRQLDANTSVKRIARSDWYDAPSSLYEIR